MRKHVYFLRFVGHGKIPPGGQATNERIRRGKVGETDGRRVCETLQMSSWLSARGGDGRGRLGGVRKVCMRNFWIFAPPACLNMSAHTYYKIHAASLTLSAFS